jgi:hypothetical protein
MQHKRRRTIRMRKPATEPQMIAMMELCERPAPCSGVGATVDEGETPDDVVVSSVLEGLYVDVVEVGVAVLDEEVGRGVVEKVDVGIAVVERVDVRVGVGVAVGVVVTGTDVLGVAVDAGEVEPP